MTESWELGDSEIEGLLARDDVTPKLRTQLEGILADRARVRRIHGADTSDNPPPVTVELPEPEPLDPKVPCRMGW